METQNYILILYSKSTIITYKSVIKFRIVIYHVLVGALTSGGRSTDAIREAQHATDVGTHGVGTCPCYDWDIYGSWTFNGCT